MFKRIIAASSALLLGVGLALIAVAGPASAHVPSITADCSGLVLHGTAYDGGKTNEYSYKIGDAATVSVNFGGSFGPVTIPIPQGGATTHVVAEIHDQDNTPAYSETFDKNIGPCGTVPGSVASTVTGTVTCDATKQLYTIVWTGSVTGVFDGYVAQRVKYTSVSPAVTVADGVVPGTGYSYTTTAAGSATSASAAFHVHVTQAAAGVNPLDADATGTVTLDGNCTPPPVACVAIPGWSTEDIAPILTPGGLEFDGPHAAAVDTYQRVSAGNMQGLTGQSVTYGTGNSGFQALVVVEVNPNADLGSGVIHYATISSVTSVVDGTVDVQNGLWYTSKIAYAQPGGQGDPISWAAITALMPNNVLLSAPSLHQQTSTPAGDKSVVLSLTSSCGSINFVPAQPTAVYSTTTTTGEVDCSVDGGGSYVITTHYWQQVSVWDAEHQVYTDPTTEPATPRDGYPDTTETVEVGTDVCPDFVTPDDPTALCGGQVVLPGVVSGTTSETANADFSVTSTTPDTITVTADPLAGFQLNPGDGYTLSEGSAVWLLPNKACPTPPTTPSTLASTGVPIGLPIGAAFLLLIAGLSLGAYRVRLSREENAS